jgi:hypothetical protein
LLSLSLGVSLGADRVIQLSSGNRNRSRTLPEAPQFGAKGDLLACRDHALASMPFKLDRVGLHAGMRQQGCHGTQIRLLDMATITQGRDEFILEKSYCCASCHGNTSWLHKLLRCSADCLWLIAHLLRKF